MWICEYPQIGQYLRHDEYHERGVHTQWFHKFKNILSRLSVKTYSIGCKRENRNETYMNVSPEVMEGDGDKGKHVLLCP